MDRRAGCSMSFVLDAARPWAAAKLTKPGRAQKRRTHRPVYLTTSCARVSRLQPGGNIETATRRRNMCRQNHPENLINRGLSSFSDSIKTNTFICPEGKNRSSESQPAHTSSAACSLSRPAHGGFKLSPNQPPKETQSHPSTGQPPAAGSMKCNTYRVFMTLAGSEVVDSGSTPTA